jgi:hypothetical protein
MKSNVVLILALAAALMMAPAGAQCVVDTDGLEDGMLSVPLLAGQTIPAGTVDVSLADGKLVVTYTTSGGWELTEAHLWVGANLADLPQTRKGNPIPGQFPYKSGDITGATTWTFEVPLAALSFECPRENAAFFVAAHAALRKVRADGSYQTETGWGDGERIVDKGNWATVFQVTLSCDCDDPGPQYGSETAFAYSPVYGTCFLNLTIIEANRWGWTIGPLAAGSYEFPIYAAAGQCDLSKGTLVGSLLVTYNGSTANVTFVMDPPYSMNVAHLYVGSEILPRDPGGDYTVAPGQYPKNSGDITGADSYSFEVTGLSGPIYVVAHTEAYGFPL